MEDYENIDLEKERKRNDDLIEIFSKDLEAAGLSEKTMENHLSNADLFLNVYALEREGYTFEKSMLAVGMFFSWFYIRKCLWSTPANLKTTVASIKKFYKSMLAHGFISKEDYDDFRDLIKECLDDWVEDCRLYNDGYF